MLDYFYDKSTIGWQDDKITELISALEEGLKDLNYSGPYVYFDRSVRVVSIRKIINLSPKKIDKLTDKADEIYRKVMLS